jgi:hypothetical protein
MTLRLLVLAGPLLLAGCNGSPTLPPVTFAEERRYGYAIPGCNPLEQESCGQEMLFRPDGSIEVNMTDILTGGSYRLEGERVHVDVEWGDDGHHYTFAIAEDGSALTDLQGGTVWHRRLPQW